MPIPKIAHKSLETMAPSDLITHTVRNPSKSEVVIVDKSHNSILEENSMLFVNYFLIHCIIFCDFYCI